MNKCIYRKEYQAKYYKDKNPDKLDENYVCEICKASGFITNISTKSGIRKHHKSVKHEERKKNS